MQNKYVGDVGDFGKYGLLRALCGEDHLTLGVVWYFVSERGVDYFSAQKDRFTLCDPELYAKLEQIARARSLSALQSADVFPRGTQFFGETVGRGSARKGWLQQAVDRVRNCEVVFLDPDTGLKQPPAEGDSARRREYAYLDEVAVFAEHGGDRSVVVYHYLGREPHDDQIKRWRLLLRETFPNRFSLALRWSPYSARAFLVVPAQAHENRLFTQARTFVNGPWGKHFRLYDTVL